MKVEFKEIGKGKYRLLVTGCVCPFPILYTMEALNRLKPGELLEVLTDNKPSSETIPEATAKRGHRVLGMEKVGGALWKITIVKGD